MDTVAARLVARPDIDLGRDVRPVTMQAGPRFRLLDDGTLWRLDDALAQTASRETALRGVRLLTASDDLDRFIVADDTRIGIAVEDVGWMHIPQADCAAFVGADRLIVTAGGEEVVLLETEGPTVLDRVTLDVEEAAFFPLPHPSDGTVLLDAGEGQDGNTIFTARCVDDSLDVKTILQGSIGAAFDRLGHKLLVTPHSSGDGLAKIFEWPSLSTAGSFDHEGLDFFGCFLGDRVLLKTFDGPVFVTDSELGSPAHVAFDLADGAEHESLHGLGESTFGTVTWIGDARATYVWALD